MDCQYCGSFLGSLYEMTNHANDCAEGLEHFESYDHETSSNPWHRFSSHNSQSDLLSNHDYSKSDSSHDAQSTLGDEDFDWSETDSSDSEDFIDESGTNERHPQNPIHVSLVQMISYLSLTKRKAQYMLDNLRSMGGLMLEDIPKS